MRTIITLDQWQALLAVVDEGGFAQAAVARHRSQSSISYAIGKLEDQLGTEVFTIEGRKAVLTDIGKALYRRARGLVDEAWQIENMARRLAAGWEETLHIAVDVIMPLPVLFEALEAFDAECGTTRVELLETVLSGTHEALLTGQADLAIMGLVPSGFVGQPIYTTEFIAVANPEHPLHGLDRELALGDLKTQRQLVVRDSGRERPIDAGWLGSEKRWTVSTMQASIEAVSHGLGFAWLPDHRIQRQLECGLLKPLPLAQGGNRQVSIYLVHANPDEIGPAARRLGELIEVAAGQLRKQPVNASS
jgi:DNA-binding transcriptional LysR family regulator